jgi:peroxiredoxin
MKKVLGVLLLCAAVTAQGANFKKVVGQAFPKVNVKDVVSGEEIDLSKTLAKEGHKGAVVFFTSTKCPVATGYEARISELAEKYSATVPFIALNANSTEDAAAQTAYTKEKGFKFHVAMDAGSKIAKEIGAGCTPEFYLIDKTGKVVYHGPLDNSQDPAQITEKLLATALDAVTTGKPVPEKTQEVQAIGCGISFPKSEKTASAEKSAHPHPAAHADTAAHHEKAK